MNFIGELIIDIVLQVLFLVIQNEREYIKQCQAERIKLAKEKGVNMADLNTLFPIAL